MCFSLPCVLLCSLSVYAQLLEDTRGCEKSAFWKVSYNRLYRLLFWRWNCVESWRIIMWLYLLAKPLVWSLVDDRSFQAAHSLPLFSDFLRLLFNLATCLFIFVTSLTFKIVCRLSFACYKNQRKKARCVGFNRVCISSASTRGKCGTAFPFSG